MPFEAVEIAIAVQKSMVVDHAPRCDKRIDGREDGYPYGPKSLIIPCRLDCDRCAGGRNYLHRDEDALDALKVSVAARALQNFGQ